MNLPEQKTETKTTSKYDISIAHSALPIVHSLSGYALEKLGWMKTGTETKGQTIYSIYKKGENEIRYSGTRWMLNHSTEIQFIEDLPKEK